MKIYLVIFVLFSNSSSSLSSSTMTDPSGLAGEEDMYIDTVYSENIAVEEEEQGGDECYEEQQDP